MELTDGDTSGQEWGSDFIADLLKAYGFEFVTFTPGASFRGIEESIVNYNDNDPRVIEAPHEILALSVAHGYAKASGETGLCILHDVVGTLHGAMGLYNAYIDRVPVLALSGTGPLRKSERRPWIEWIHSSPMQGDLVREFTKWDDQPADMDGVTESILRGIKVAETPPTGPTYVTLDHDLQECPLEEAMEIPDFEKFGRPSRMAPDPDAVAEAADLLLEADQPVILVDQVGDSRDAVEALVELAETLGAAVVEQRQHRYNFPNTHPLYHADTDVYRDADVVLGIDVRSLNHTLTNVDPVENVLTEAIDGEFSLINVGTHDLGISSVIVNYYKDRETHVPILAESEQAIPALQEAVDERMEPADRERAAERVEELGSIHDDYRERWRSEVEDTWDETPISIPRLTAEIGEVIAGEAWTIVNGTLRGWPHRLWDIDEFDKYVGGTSGGAGLGYGPGAAVGAALAYHDTGRIPINLQADGDFFMYPSSMWMMSHYDLPIFNVVHNNRAFYNSTNHRIELAKFRGRDASLERARIGTGIWDPTPDYAAVAESMGVNGYGPIEDPGDLAPALEAAWKDARSGQPALVDVISQPR